MSAGRIANALSNFRLIASVVSSLFVVFVSPGWWWFGVIVLIALASLTDPIDGRIARKGTPAPNGKQKNEVATGALSILLPGSILVHQLVGRFWLHWPESTTSNLVVWAVACVVFVVGTLFVFNRARSVLVPKKAELFEVWQAWFTALILVACAAELFLLSWKVEFEQKPPFGVFVLFIAAALALVALAARLSGERFLERRAEREAGLYKGTKQNLYGRG